ncbi:MAG: hypothetical protein HC781_21305 [Leptolyngbyaceae cyanobacterium CSU_1_4]|nr:hypothetical protein [Leptolyngbyaceae cyanobacterium CSU_1_4]
MPKPSQASDLPLSVTYPTLCHQIKIGDVITFSGTDFPSEVVKIATQSIYVHVAIAHSVDPQAPPETAILIAESHIDRSLPSVGTGKRALGVQFQWLFNRLAQYPGQAWWTPLKTPLTLEGIARLQVWLQTMESQEIPYDFIQAIGAGMAQVEPLQVRNTPDFSALFCSELVTRALQIAGAIDETLNPSEQTAADVMRFPCFKQPRLIQGELC